MKKTNRGFTLVELMVVVIVIGILAATAMFGYKAYMDQARVTRLQAYVTSLASKQNDAMSRQVSVPFTPGVYSAATKASYENVLGFSETVYPDIILETEAWTPSTGGACTKCATYGIPAPAGNVGYMAVAQQDMNPGGDKTTVYITSGMPAPVQVNVGE